MNSLIVSPSLNDSSVTMADAARFNRDELLNQAALVTTIADRIDYDDAIGVLKSLKGFLSDIETQRASAKAPALDLGRKIDALAKELTQKTEIEAGRISRVLGSYEAEERRKADEARREAEYKEREIARAAQKAEQEARRKASTQEGGDRAADVIVEKAQAEIVQVQQAAINAAVPKTEGAKLRGDVKFELIDIKALYAEHPELCTIEPNGTAIRAILRIHPNLKLPGINHWIEHKVSI